MVWPREPTSTDIISPRDKCCVPRHCLGWALCQTLAPPSPAMNDACLAWYANQQSRLRSKKVQDFAVWRLRQPTARNKPVPNVKKPTYFCMLRPCPSSHTTFVDFIAKQDSAGAHRHLSAGGSLARCLTYEDAFEAAARMSAARTSGIFVPPSPSILRPVQKHIQPLSSWLEGSRGLAT